jgi:hypothetical protein
MAMEMARSLHVGRDLRYRKWMKQSMNLKFLKGSKKDRIHRFH